MPNLLLSDYEPRSKLRVRETRVEQARFPVIDFHTHLSFSQRIENGVPIVAERTFLAPPQELLDVMDRKNVSALINLTGGFEQGLTSAIEQYDEPFPGRFFTFTEPRFHRFAEPDFANKQADAIIKAHARGAKGVKILKTLGLYLRENVTTGKLIAVDDPRFDPTWEVCADLNLPVALHVSDPVAFYDPIDRFNERYEELHAHPEWSFDADDFPSHDELLEQRNRVFARHPRTQFVALHAGNYAEDLQSVSECLERFPNMHVDIAARIGELGRQPRTARAFFDEYQDRILFGTDATPRVDDYPQQIFCDELYEIYFRFLETDDEYFDYAPARVPPQGRWRIYGIHLPEQVLRKVYYGNAARLLGITQ